MTPGVEVAGEDHGLAGVVDAPHVREHDVGLASTSGVVGLAVVEMHVEEVEDPLGLLDPELRPGRVPAVTDSEVATTELLEQRGAIEDVACLGAARRADELLTTAAEDRVGRATN